MYRNDNRTVITLDAGGTNFVFGAMRANEFIVEPITMPSNADDLDKCLATLVSGFEQVIAKKGVNVPIEAGIMPVINKKQIERMVTLCGASLPPKFAKMMQKYGDNPEAIVESGIAYAVDQIVDLLSYNVDGIHLYAMNNPYVVNKIYSAIEKLL